MLQVTKRGLLGLLVLLGCATAVAGGAARSSPATQASVSIPPVTIAPTASPRSPSHAVSPQQKSPSDDVVITGQVKDVESNAYAIHLAEQVHGFTTITLGPGVQIVSVDGSPMTLQDIKPGNMIQSDGQAVGSDTVLATRIRVLPAPTTGGNRG